MQIFFLLAQLVPTSLSAQTLTALTLKGGEAKGGLEQNMLRGVALCQPATHKDLVPDYLYVAGPPPGHPNRNFNGHLKMEIARENSAPGERIPNMLHLLTYADVCCQRIHIFMHSNSVATRSNSQRATSHHFFGVHALDQ